MNTILLESERKKRDENWEDKVVVITRMTETESDSERWRVGASERASERTKKVSERDRIVLLALCVDNCVCAVKRVVIHVFCKCIRIGFRLYEFRCIVCGCIST